jgi:hypothetical protein
MPFLMLPPMPDKPGIHGTKFEKILNPDFIAPQ